MTTIVREVSASEHNDGPNSGEFAPIMDVPRLIPSGFGRLFALLALAEIPTPHGWVDDVCLACGCDLVPGEGGRVTIRRAMFAGGVRGDYCARCATRVGSLGHVLETMGLGWFVTYEPRPAFGGAW